uniref:Uncharacterized protein n=1 Tax=Panagrellus redivivus TaxID=6233 RepID=A0A7E4WBN4_PANRE
MVIDLQHGSSKRHRIVYCIFITLAFIFTSFALFSKHWAEIDDDYPHEVFPRNFGVLPGFCESSIEAPETCKIWEKESHHFLTTVAVLVGLSAVLELIAYIYNLILIPKWGDSHLRHVPLIVLTVIACVSFICACLIFKKKKGETIRFYDEVQFKLDPIVLGFFAHIANTLSIITAFFEIRTVKEEARLRKMQISQRQPLEMRRF